MKGVKPSDVENKDVPQYVFDAFDEIIRKNIDKNGMAQVRLRNVYDILKETTVGGWCFELADVKDQYQLNGWLVKMVKTKEIFLIFNKNS